MRDQRGVTAVEFGLLAFPFFLIIAGILQTSLIFLSSAIMETAVQDATRQVRTGQMASATIGTFRDAVCDGLYGLFDCSGFHIRVSPITDFATATAVPPVNATCPRDCAWTTAENFNPGVGRNYMMVQVYYRYPVPIQFGPFGMANLADGSRLMGTATVFQNEPFS